MVRPVGVLVENQHVSVENQRDGEADVLNRTLDCSYVHELVVGHCCWSLPVGKRLSPDHESHPVGPLCALQDGVGQGGHAAGGALG